MITWVCFYSIEFFQPWDLLHHALRFFTPCAKPPGVQNDILSQVILRLPKDLVSKGCNHHILKKPVGIFHKGMASF